VIPDHVTLHRRARQLLPSAVYDYYAGGAGRERTLRANERAWRQVWLAPRVLTGARPADTSTRLLGTPVATPVCVAPTGFQRLAHPDGELATAAGAARAGALFVLSTRSSSRIEAVAEAVAAGGGAWWFQVYIMRDRELTASLVRRAAAAGAAALVLTADTPVVGRKRRDSASLVIPDADLEANTGPLADPAASEQAADLTFADIGWLSGLSGGLPVVVKGVLRGDDARACRAAGAAAVIVSNHGGRQLDGAVPAVMALPPVLAALRALDDGAPAYLDGGIRTGDQVLAALALGAGAVFLGRPALWALACGGAAAVTALLTGLTADLAHSMTLAGAASLADVSGLARTSWGPGQGQG
jgi:4-hydroxymandelate oxidase